MGVDSHPAASSSRPLGLRMRADLISMQQTYQGRTCWVVKDPLALSYHRFEPEEYALLELLDGRRSPAEIKRQFERRFAPQQLTLDELHQFAGSLYRASLVVSDSPGQGRELHRRHDQNQRRRRWTSLAGMLAIRLPGVDPDRFLTWLDRKAGWLFSRWAVAAGVMLVLAALLLVGCEFETFRTRLPTFHEFFGAGNWIWLAVVVISLKVLHELGHGLACKRLGGECHEMGLMLLIFLPCLYCNVTDSWMLRNKWHRAAVGAAGMYVELVLAALATFLWWFTAPGLVNALALNVMFVSSASTLLVNGNPLLRYDGYYILSDLAEIPNLQQKAAHVVRRTLGAWLLGLPPAHDPFLPVRRPWPLAVYAVAAAVYRWVITFSIFWFLYHALEPLGMKVLGQTVAAASLAVLVIAPVVGLVRFFVVPGRIQQVKRFRMLAGASAAAAALAAVMLIPLPHYVVCTLHVQPRDAASVYVDVPGTVRTVCARPGESIEAGRPLLVLENIELRLAVERLEGQRQQLASQLAGLQQRVFEDESAGLEMGTVEEEIAAVDEQLARRRRDLERLTITAPVAGTVVPAAAVVRNDKQQGRLSTWSGTPLDEKNRGALLDDGVLVCRLGRPRELEAILAVDQADVEFVAPEQRVDVFLSQQPGRRYKTSIRHVAEVDMKLAPKGLSSRGGGELLTATDAAGLERPLSATYEASASLDNLPGLVAVGGTGRARIHVGHQTIGYRLWRAFCQTFEFKL